MRSLYTACIRPLIDASLIVLTCFLSGVIAAGTSGNPLLTGGMLGAGIGLVVNLIWLFSERTHEHV